VVNDILSDDRSERGQDTKPDPEEIEICVAQSSAADAKDEQAQLNHAR
jgi:hypothetical protein